MNKKVQSVSEKGKLKFPKESKISSPPKKSVSKKTTIKKATTKKTTKTKAKKKNKQLSEPIKQTIKQGVYGKFQSYKALCEALNITPANRYDRPKQKEQIEEYYLLQEKKGGRYEILPKQQIIDGHQYYISLESISVLSLDDRLKYKKIEWNDYVYFILVNTMMTERWSDKEQRYIEEKNYDFVKNRNNIFCCLFYRTRLVQDLLIIGNTNFDSASFRALRIFNDEVIRKLSDKINYSFSTLERQEVFKVKKTYTYYPLRKKDGKWIVDEAKPKITDDDTKDKDPNIKSSEKSRMYRFTRQTFFTMKKPKNQWFTVYSNFKTMKRFIDKRNSIMESKRLKFGGTRWSLIQLDNFEYKPNLYEDMDSIGLQSLWFLTQFFIIFRAEVTNTILQKKQNVLKNIQDPEVYQTISDDYDKAIELVNKYCVPCTVRLIDNLAPNAPQPDIPKDLFPKQFYFYSEEDFYKYLEISDAITSWRNSLDSDNPEEPLPEPVFDGILASQMMYFMDVEHFLFTVDFGKEHSYYIIDNLDEKNYEITLEEQKEIEEIAEQYYGANNDSQ